MNTLLARFIPALAAGAVLATALSPVAAAADPSEWPQPGSQPADVILRELESTGYNVGINWTNNGKGVPLARCQVSGYHAPGVIDAADPAFTTIYVDVVCPDED
jgi:hypothetical protein